MEANTQPLPLADRADIHKSCKSLETLLNIFNDYCEAAGAVVTLQKKLSKSLRETAGLKVTGDIAANALNASATIFESLSEIDSRFAKLVDKEYDAISSEVKKWFKKLAKEEKAHDERIVTANTKIKQAGQIYEKKSKKNARDVSDEHIRYINLISSLGPEISQEKYNHTLLVTQRHTAATYSVAACLSRIADAEWLRTCEGVRRFGPTIGQLGEWRALCEGGWTGPVPEDLPDVDNLPSGPESTARQDNPSATLRNIEPSSKENEQQQAFRAPPSYEREPEYQTPQYSDSIEHNNSMSTAPSAFDPPRALVDPNTGSVRSLSAFPNPPTHFPPPLRQQSYQGQSRSPSQVSFPTRAVGRLGEDTLTEEDETPPVSSNSSPETKYKENPMESNSPNRNESLSQQQSWRSMDSYSQQEASGSTSSSTPTNKGDYFSEDVDYKSRSMAPKAMERNDTGASNGSIVAAMRSRYSYNSGAVSPPPRDLPKLPTSVNDLASRYRNPDEPASPRMMTGSPPISRGRPSLDSYVHGSLGPVTEGPAVHAPVAEHDPASRRQQLVEQLADLERQEKEQELRSREREFDMRYQERNRTTSMGNSGADSGQRSAIASRSPPLQAQPLRPRERQLSLQQRPPSQNELAAPSNTTNNRSHSPYSYRTDHLAPPLSPATSRQGGSDETSESPRDTSEHAPYCGCETCSASKYRSSPQPKSPTTTNLRSPVPEKPKGWMRRLSMPIVVSNAFLDGKKNHSNTNLSVYGGKTGGLASLDSKKNGSNVALRGGITEDGKISPGAAGIGAGGRRSYDAGGISNRSVTNVGRQ
ncbi:hypothetical protein C8J56DRAFT_1162124 [Mycena floridula]|nr:hypothetical protein C8J56DRAFT_1162124 [Mycena floridula]